MDYNKKAKGREDKRLAALEYMEAGKELKTAAANIHDYTSYTAGSVLKKGTELKELGQAQITSAQELKNASLINRYANTATANAADYKTKVGKDNISKGNAELADLENDKAGYKAKKRAKADNLVNIRVSIGSSSSRSESSLMKQIHLMGALWKVLEILSLRLIVQTLSKEILKLLVKQFQVKQ